MTPEERREYWTSWVKNNLRDEHTKRGDKCVICGQPELPGPRGKLDMAHIDETPLSGTGGGRGRVERLYDARRNPTSYCLMHHGTCHREFDSGRIRMSKTQLLLRQKQLSEGR